MNRIYALLWSVATLFLLPGCVSKVVEEEHPPVMIIAQNSDGEITMQWQSDLNHVYTVYCQKTPGSDWVTLPTANRLPGTGKMMVVHDRTNPRNPPRRYRVLPKKP